MRLQVMLVVATAFTMSVSVVASSQDEPEGEKLYTVKEGTKVDEKTLQG